MNESTIAIIISVGTLLLSLIANVVGGTWILRGSNARLMESFDQKLDARRKELVREIAEIERRSAIGLDETNRRSGELISAIREKVVQVELWVRDNCVSKDTFNLVIGEIKESWRRFEDKMDARFDKIESKLESDQRPSQ